MGTTKPYRLLVIRTQAFYEHCFLLSVFELIFVRIYCSIGIINSGTVRCDMVRNNVSICPVCGENLKPYDKILRIVCMKGRKILWKWGL